MSSNFNPHFSGSDDKKHLSNKMIFAYPLMFDMLRLINNNLDSGAVIEPKSIIHDWVKITLEKAA